MTKSKEIEEIDEVLKRVAIGKVAVIILETQKSDDGQYVPVIVHEGKSGYYLTDWKWGTDKRLAEQTAKRYNERLGNTGEDVIRLIGQSFRLRRN
jgi:hypothetical protein